MLPRHFVYLVVCGIVSLPVLAADVVTRGDALERPACNADTLGKMWPLQANGNRELTNKLFNCGELQVCTRGKWRYHWHPLSVRVDQLSKDGTIHMPRRCELLLQELKSDQPVNESRLGGVLPTVYDVDGGGTN